ncbi:hypothetical protein KM043_000317 [Ampulex compressa]|nr:hypothetical protein KM043_000317 [Ampulex compressa]
MKYRERLFESDVFRQEPEMASSIRAKDFEKKQEECDDRVLEAALEMTSRLAGCSEGDDDDDELCEGKDSLVTYHCH